jgi:signal transduction histidine kinase
MSEKKVSKGAAILCDSLGNIERVLRDDLAVEKRAKKGKPFASIAAGGDLVKALNFMMELRSKGAAFDWQINVDLEGKPTTLHFAGARGPDSILVIAARDSNGVMALYEEMMRINNEQINDLRASAKARAEMVLEKGRQDRLYYDELTRLNNELANLQRELVKKNVELERLNEQKNRFLGMAAHDLRNPLGAIMMYAEFLEEEAAAVLDGTQTEFLAIIKSTSEFMLQMVNDLLDLAKIESGKLELEKTPSDLVSLAFENVRLNQPIAKRKHIRIVFRSDCDEIWMELDPGKISQVFQNLVSNAVKYSHPETLVEVLVSKSVDGASATVKDQGQGIPEDQLDLLFKPFHRTTVKTTAGEESTGLGLAIARKIVEGHGGTIGVESRVGIGSEFTFSIPAD